MKLTPAVAREYLEAELSGVLLGDERRNERCKKVVGALASSPGVSIPRSVGNENDLEATYRFLANPAIDAGAILAPHRAQIAQRITASTLPLVAIHDASEMVFAGEFPREGLGILSHGRQGFVAQCSLIAGFESDSTHRDIIGVPYLAVDFPNGPVGKKYSYRVRKTGPWKPAFFDVHNAYGGLGKRLIHVADRETDAYHLFSELVDADISFVLRGHHDRRLSEGGKIWDTVHQKREIILRRTVELNARRPGEVADSRSADGRSPLRRAKTGRPKVNQKKHAGRRERVAELAITALRVSLLRPEPEVKSYPDQLTLNVVRVFETETPEGCVPVEWLLYTTLPIETEEEIALIVDAYRARWLIEEFFKALKTGCGFEKLQLEKRQSFINALAAYSLVAWVMMRLRSQSRLEPEQPATTLLSPRQLEILPILRRRPLPQSPTVRDVAYAIAELGGHIKNNGDPGWLTLGRGMESLLMAEVGWMAARGEL